ncbi:tetratricopeptide repeat protein [Rhodobacteraceae bacterium CYK-10]|uniref:Tetratricopeptide repeat protein n=2 Tax=Stagnihabitans tardus TaxID=2699202 RepID=A0AAE4YC40_9RHOB|nr:tetratricopeptide repeat protein [Stagnihabitans tardus]
MLIAASVAAASTQLPLPNGVIESLAGGGSLWTGLRNQARTDADQTLKRLKASLATEWQAWSSAQTDARLRAHAVASFEEVLPFCALTPSEIAGRALSPTAMADLFLTKAAQRLPEAYADRGERHPDTYAPRQFLHRLTLRAYTDLIAEPGYVTSLAPALWQAALGGLDRIERTGEDTHRIVTDVRAQLQALAVSNADRQALVDQITQLRTEKAATDTLIATFLQRLIDQNLPPDQFQPSLNAIAEAWFGMKAELERLARNSNLSPELDSLRAAAKAAYAAEDSAELRRLLDLIAMRQKADFSDLTARLDQQKAEYAETLTSQLALAQAEMRAEDAARHIVDRLSLECPKPGLSAALREESDRRFETGRVRGHVFDIRLAVVLAMESADLALDVAQRRAAQFCCAIYLSHLGRIDGGLATLQHSVEINREILSTVTPDTDLAERASTLNNYAGALQMYGYRECNAETLLAAVDALEQAKEIWRELNDGARFALASHNLGACKNTLASITGLPFFRHEALDAYEEALLVRTRARDPEEWAMTMTNIGNTLSSLASAEANSELLDRAINCYEEVKEVWTFSERKQDWALVQVNLSRFRTH